MIALDCQTFGGAFSLGVARAGFKIVGKREGSAGFGVPMYRDNADLLGIDRATIQTDEPAAWQPADVDLVFGNPACSGFSVFSTQVSKAQDGGARKLADYRGIDCVANKGMWDFIDLAGSCDAPVVIFESVTGAYTIGRNLMQDLRDRLQVKSRQQYALHHVLHNNSALGGCTERRRYFFVASRVPFGVAQPQIDAVKTLRDCIEDLQHVPLDREMGHVTLDVPRARRLAELALKVNWRPGEFSGSAYQRAMEQNVQLDLWNNVNGDKSTNMFAAIRWEYDRPGRVVRQYACTGNVHPELPRCFTFREIARIMGLPDEWSVEAAIAKRAEGQLWFGKGIPVESGQWIATWAANSLAGQPGPITGTLIGDREYLIDVRKPKLSAYANMDRLFDE